MAYDNSDINERDINKRVMVEELVSARTLASEHLLAVAKLPLGVLSTRWKVGKNRIVDEGHVKSLRQSFMNRGLGRLDQENYMKVTCSAQAVAAITARLRDKSPGPTENDLASDCNTNKGPPRPIPQDFRAWAEATNELVELLDGQHRLKAAQQVLDHGDNDDMWWTCEIYNKGMIVILVYKPPYSLP